MLEIGQSCLWPWNTTIGSSPRDVFKTAIAAEESGTRWMRLAFVRSARIVQEQSTKSNSSTAFQLLRWFSLRLKR